MIILQLKEKDYPFFGKSRDNNNNEKETKNKNTRIEAF